jgi:hypothetical protein
MVLAAPSIKQKSLRVSLVAIYIFMIYVAGLPERVIAEIMGWEEKQVARIIRRYVDRSAATKAIIQHLNETRT